MRIFGFLDRKKQIAPAPSSKSSVHPASNGRAGYYGKRAKIKELLGVATPQECREVDELFNRRPWQMNPSSSTDDDDNEEDDEGEEDDSVDDGSTKEGARGHRIIATPQQNGRSIPDLQVSTIHVVNMAAQKLALPPYKSPSAKTSGEHAARKPCPIDTTVKANPLQVSVKITLPSPRGEDCATRKPSAADMTAKASPIQFSLKKGRPPRLTGIGGKAVAFSSRNGLGTTSERTMAPHPSRIRGKKNASCVESSSFPLPSPFEKHYLPTPQARTPEEVFSVAHPLPQPPPTMRISNGCGLEQADEKGNNQFARAVSYDVFVKPQLSEKECLAIRHTISLDPLRKLTQKHKTSQSLIGMATQGLQHTPPTTPRPQASRTPQNTNLPTPPGMQLHHTPQSTPPTTPRTQLQQTPQNTPPTTPRTQLQQTPQNTPPVTPRSRHHPPQVFINVPHNAQSPPSSNRQSPRLSTPLYSQSPSHFPSQQFAYSPPMSPLQRPLCPRKWRKGDILGQGTFGTVYKGLNEEDGSYFAVKVSSAEDTSPEIQQEVDVLSKLEHPNIVRYFGSSVVENRLCIFLELVRMGSLDSILKNFKCFDDHTIRFYTRQILLGLEYLHSRKTIHRDIKGGNILVDVTGQVKLSDFGIAKQVGESLASSLKGTPLYMAPEVLMPDKNSQIYYSYPADIWSLGCTVFELADGKPPWGDLQGFAFFFKVKSKELPPMPGHLSDEGRDFIRRCLHFHPNDRPTASDLLQHPFVSNVATPEYVCPLSSPSSPLSPKLWQPFPQSSSSTWACGHYCPSSPGQMPQFDHVLGGSQRAQSLVYGR